MNEWTNPAQPVRCLVDLSAPLTVRYAKGVLVQGDEYANAIVAEVYQREGVPCDLTGCTATLTFVRPDNMAAAPIAAEIAGNVAVATLTDLCYRVSGTYVASLQLKKDGAERTIVRIVGEILSNENSGTVTEEQILPTPEELLETLQEVEEARANAAAAAEAANTAAAEAGTAANNTNEAIGRANAAAASIEGMTASAEQLAPDAPASATVTDVDGVKHITFGIPKGERGEKGEKGDPGTAENVTIDSIAGLREELNNKQPKGDYLPADGTAEDANKLGGKLPEEYLAANGTAADASKLGGKLPEAYATKENLEQYATKEDLENLDIPDAENVPWEKVTDKPDHIVDQGTSGVWSYRKWESGIAECWFNVTHRIDSFEAAWGNLFESDEYFPAYDFPFTIYEVKAEAMCPTANLGVIVASRSRTNLKASTPLIFARPQKTTSGATAFVGYYVVGTWKE